MDLGLDGRHAFVAGSSSGIGLAVAAGFLREGAHVTISGRTAATVERAAAELRAQGGGRVGAFVGDLTDALTIERALDAAGADVGPVDCVVANVGIGASPLGWEVADDDWFADLRQNLTGSMFLARSALTRMAARPAEERRRCTITFVSSIAGVQSLGSSLPYGAAKAGLEHASRSLAKLAGSAGVRVNTVAPGNVLFPGGNWERRVSERPEAWGRWIQREVALRRFGTVDEIADAVVWVASERAAFVTGASLVVDGGQLR